MNKREIQKVKEILLNLYMNIKIKDLETETVIINFII